jgi:hypothetical protein
MEVIGIHGAILPTALRRQASFPRASIRSHRAGKAIHGQTLRAGYFWPEPEIMDLGGGFSPDLGYMSLPL